MEVLRVGPPHLSQAFPSPFRGQEALIGLEAVV